MEIFLDKYFIVQGAVQWVQINPSEPFVFHSFSIQFQGGFAARRIQLEIKTEDEEYSTLEQFFPDDHSKLQISFFSSIESSKERLFLLRSCSKEFLNEK